jgi:hypothetical protein
MRRCPTCNIDFDGIFCPRCGVEYEDIKIKSKGIFHEQQILAKKVNPELIYSSLVTAGVASLCFLLSYCFPSESFNLMLFCFFLFFLSILLCGFSIVIPVLKMRQNVHRKGNAGEKWDCPKCKHKNPNTRFKCMNCGYQLV